MLATAKAIPRNGYIPTAMPPAEIASVDSPTLDVKPGWLKALEPAMPAIVGSVLRNVGSMFHRNAAPPPMNDNGSAATARLMRVRSRLTATERQILDEALLDEGIAEQVMTMLADACATHSRVTSRCAARRSRSSRTCSDISTIVMTMRYAHLAPEVGRDAVRLLDGGNRGSGMAAEAKTKAN